MNLKGLLKNWFGYSRSERMGSFILAIIIVIIVVISLLRKDKSDRNEQTILIGQDSVSNDSLSRDNHFVAQRDTFNFDPNTVNHRDLIRLGLSERQASTLINYREAGATFRDTSDFRKIYGIEKDLQDQLIPLIIIKEVNPGKNSKQILNPGKSEYKPYTDYLPEDDSPDLNDLYFDINSADSIQLDSLPGIGRVLGTRIIKYRNLLGGYASVEQLSEVYGIDTVLVNSIYELVYADSNLIKKKEINFVKYKELISHPYVSNKLCEDILYYRKIAGRVESIDVLIKNRIIDSVLALKITPYFSFTDSIPY